MKSIMRSIFLILAVALISACSSGVKLDEAKVPVEDRSGVPAQATGPGGDTRPVTKVDVAADPLNDPNSPLARRSVYFDFDSFIVKDEFQGVVEAHSKYLLSSKGRKVVIQGNADERGGSEYNLALGQKRAEAVRKAIQLLGVPEVQMEAVSLGKEKPRALGHDEAAWAENRRADLIYQ